MIAREGVGALVIDIVCGDCVPKHEERKEFGSFPQRY